MKILCGQIGFASTLLGCRGKLPAMNLESIINSMIGAVNIFIDSINNYLTRFPKLRTEEKYREQTKEIMMALRNYINDVEGALK